MREKLRNKIGRKSKVFLVIVILSIFLASTAKSETSITNSGSTLDENLVAEYRFDTGAGDTAYDTAGNNDGRITGARWVAEEKGNSLLFDSTSEDYVQTPDNLDVPQQYSLFIWIKGDLEDQLSENIYPFGFNNKIELTASAGSNARGGILIRNGADDGYHSVWDGTNVLDGNWHHWGATVNRDTGTVSIYLDGNIIHQETIPDHYSGSRQLNIGSWSETYGHFEGKIKNAKFYADELTASEVKSLYNSGSWKVRSANENRDPSKVLDMNFQHLQNGEVLDTSGNSNHGSIENGATQIGSAGCKVGRCFSFDGNDDYIQVDQDSSINISGEISISQWIKPRNVPSSGDERIWAKSGGTSGTDVAYQSYIRDGNPKFEYLAEGAWKGVKANSVIDEKEWVHITYTYDGEEAKLYLNGKLDATAQESVGIETNEDPLNIGYDTRLESYFDGKIDQMRIYDQSLSEKEVWKLYTQGKNRFSNGMPGPVAHYPMKTESSPVVDVAGGNNGALDAIGEAGTFNTSDGNWQTVHFRKDYTDPVIVGTTNTHNGQSAIYFETRNVQSNKAEMRLCESEGGNNDGCDTHGTERGGYVVVDAASTDQVSGIEAGTFTTSSNSVSFSNGFTNTPVVFTQVMTDNNEGEVVSWVTSKDNESFSAKICDQSSTDGCDFPDEEFGWIAVEPGNEPFAQSLEAEQLANEVGSSNWASTTFDASFSENPVGVFSVQNNDGGQDPKVDEIRNVDSNGMEMRFCELQTGDTCDGHADMAYAYLAAEKGLLTAKDSSSPKYVDTQRGKALDFDGNDDSVEIVEDFSQDNITFTTWVKADRLSDGWILNKFRDKGDGWGLKAGSGGILIYDDIDGVDNTYYQTDLDGSWHHLAISMKENENYLYVDGKKKGSGKTSSSTLSSFSGNLYMTQRGTNANYYDGKIDDVRIYPYALNQSQITRVMNGGAVNIG